MGLHHFCYVVLRKKVFLGGSKPGELRNADRRIKNALIDIANPKKKMGL